jgi:opacity protein-like surface antigen
MKKMLMMALMLCCSGWATADEGAIDQAVVDAAKSVRVNGFISQGYLHSDKNNFLATTKKKGSSEFNEVGLTITANVTPKLRIGTQFLSRDLGPVGNNEVRLDWAFGDYHVNDYFGVRIGKVKMPIGLYNQGRDSDFVRPMIFLPQSIYDEIRRDQLLAYEGGGIYGNIPLAAAGDLEYQGFVGELNFQDDSILVKSFKSSAQKMLGATPMTSFTVDNKYVLGGAVVYNTSLSGLRLGVSFMQGQSDVTVGASTITTTKPNGEMRLKNKMVYSLEYTNKYFLLAGEYSESDRNQVILNQVLKSSPSQEYYGMASINLMDRLSLNLLYDVIYESMGDKHGELYKPASKAAYDFMGWRKDHGIGFRYDVNQYWTLKAEYHYVDGCANLMQILNPPPTIGATVKPDLQHYWDYVAIKASFNF